ncbi:MAG: DUF86 domain-containing protein [Actinomycetota bacterium]|nr:DUF86 domain-containing protein [Actinomycetota bacterium]
MVDPVSLERRLALLAEHRRRLRDLARLSAAEYDARRFEARYLVQVCAQLCIDLANHVIASEAWGTARDARDAFARLAERGVLPPELARRLQALAGLRNRLVHLYDEIDDDLVRAALPEGLDDLDGFARAIAALVL